MTHSATNNDATHAEHTPSQAGDVRSDAIGPGAQVGRYRVISELGRGGMGVVYLAQQHEPVQRTVALKLLQAELLTEQAAMLFSIESQALAQMEHPAIARIFDAGRTADGHPWFAMERIDGHTLGHWLKHSASSRLTRLRLFVAICQGAAHAHQKGVIHRDLKLGNIMISEVDGQPQPKIIDFGLALGVLGAQRAPLMRGGTRDYMSPEQRAGDPGIDVRSDVYALGVILLKLLAPDEFFAAREKTSPPLPLPDLLDRSLHGPGDTASQSEVAPSLRCLAQIDLELRWILRHALASGRDQRYGSAQELADDIQLYIAGRPVRAVPDKRGYRLRKFVQRNRPIVLASVAAILCLIAGTVAATLGLLRANVERQRAEIALEQVRIEAIKAQRLSQFLTDLISGISPESARGMDTRLLRLIVDDAANRAARELADEPMVLAEVQGTMASTYNAIGDDRRALELAQAALDLLDKSAPKSPLRLSLAARLAVFRIYSGDEEHGLPQLDQATAALLASDQASARDQMWAQSELAWFRTYQSGNLDSSLQTFQELVPRMREELGPDRRDTLVAALRLAILTGAKERFAEASAMMDDLLERRIRVYGADHPDTLAAQNSQAILFLDQRDFESGAKVLRALLERSERIFRC